MKQERSRLHPPEHENAPVESRYRYVQIEHQSIGSTTCPVQALAQLAMKELDHGILWDHLTQRSMKLRPLRSHHCALIAN